MIDVQKHYELDECFLLPVLRIGVARCECCNEVGAIGITIGWLWWAISLVHQIPAGPDHP